MRDRTAIPAPRGLHAGSGARWLGSPRPLRRPGPAGRASRGRGRRAASCSATRPARRSGAPRRSASPDGPSGPGPAAAGLRVRGAARAAARISGPFGVARLILLVRANEHLEVVGVRVHARASVAPVHRDLTEASPAERPGPSGDRRAGDPTGADRRLRHSTEARATDGYVPVLPPGDAIRRGGDPRSGPQPRRRWTQPWTP